MTFTSRFKHIVLAAAASAATFVAAPAMAALNVGDKAPDFTLTAATNGKAAPFKLSDALKRGPVVVYFYPKAFTGGCSLEAHQFSEAVPQFATKNVTVIGVSADGIDVLKDFSTQTCQGRFAVASDPGAKVAASYDAKMGVMAMSSRVSYLIGTNGKVLAVHDNGDASGHVAAMLAAAGL